MMRLSVILVFILVGCAPSATPMTAPTAGAEIFSADFSGDVPFTVIRGEGSTAEGLFTFGQDESTYAWAVAEDTHANVIIEEFVKG